MCVNICTYTSARACMCVLPCTSLNALKFVSKVVSKVQGVDACMDISLEHACMCVHVRVCHVHITAQRVNVARACTGGTASKVSDSS